MARILIIDDNTSVRDVLRDLLEGDGHEVVEAEDGRVGVRLHGEAPADLVIVDMFMPGKGGLKTITELRHQSPDVRIIAVSGGAMRGHADHLPLAKKLGAIRTFAKPFNVNEFLRAVRGILER